MKARLHSPNPKSVILTRGLIQKSLCEKCSNAELFLVRIFLYLGWIRTRNNSVFRHFSCSECLLKLQNNLAFSIIHHLQADPCMKQKISLHIIPVHIIVSWINRPEMGLHWWSTASHFENFSKVHLWICLLTRKLQIPIYFWERLMKITSSRFV